MKSHYSKLIPVFSLFLVLAHAPAILAQGINEKITVESIREENHVNIFVRNGNPFTITVSLNITGQNLRKPRGRLKNIVVDPNSKLFVTRVFIKDPNKSFQVETKYNWFIGNVNSNPNEAYVYALPFKRGSSYPVAQGYNGSFSHTGKSKYAVDFQMPVGTPVMAARDGVVVQTHAESDIGGPSEKYARDSNFIIIQHSDGSMSEYAHLKKDGVFVEPGDRVSKRQKIGLSGNTGYSSGPHLHFMVSRVLEDGSTQSIPFRFRAKEGVIEHAKEGEMYTAL